MVYLECGVVDSVLMLEQLLQLPAPAVTVFPAPDQHMC